ncbi:MAG: helix-turn-helix domain-containing protein [Bacillaceae bacterium]
MENDLLERKIHGSEMFPLQIYHNTFEKGKHDLYLHWHNEIEFLFIEDGEGVFQINFIDYYVKKGDLLIIPKGAIHAGYGFKEIGCQCIGIVFDPRMLQSHRMDTCQIQYISPILKDELQYTVHLTTSVQGYDELLHYFMCLCKAYKKENQLEVKGLLYLLFACLFQYNHMKKKETLPKGTEKKIKKVKDVIEYIHENYHQSISVKELATITHYSEYHFVRFFKQEVGMTCTEYINSIRLNRAANLLINTNAPILTIAYEVGFENISYFIKKFKEKYEMTPSHYRKGH